METEGYLACHLPEVDPLKDLKNLVHGLQCSLVPSENPPHFQSGLSTYWAQEYVGSDLARERLLAENISLTPGKVGVWDNIDQDHGILVANNIASPTLTALIPGEAPGFSQVNGAETVTMHKSYSNC